MITRQIWKTLGIAQTTDRSEIRRAYARLLKVTNPEDDADGFQNLRAAYEAALEAADGAARSEPLPERPPQPGGADTSPDNWKHLLDLQLTGAGPSTDAGSAPPSSAPLSPLAQAFEDACVRLEAMFDPLSIAMDDERLEALIVILTAPYGERQASAETTEAWLIRLLLDNQPRSDMLLAPAAAHFGWAAQIAAGQNAGMIGDDQYTRKLAIVRRMWHIAFLRSVSKPGSANYYAYTTLSRPPQREPFLSQVFSASARREIRQFLDHVRRDQPSVEAELNASTVALWDARLERPALSGVSSWMALLSLPCLAVVLLSTLFSPEVFGMTLFSCFVPLLWTGVWMLYSRGVALPRLKWSKDPRRKKKPWRAFGWGPALIALLFLAAAPASAELTSLIVVLALLIIAWVMITGEPDREHGDWPWRFRLILAEIFLMTWWLTSLHALAWDAIVQMSVGVGAAVIVAGYGRLPLYRRWLALDPRNQRGILYLLRAGCVVAAIGLVLAFYEPSLIPVTFAGGAALLLMLEVPVVNTQPWRPLWRRVAMTIVVIMQFMEPLAPLVPMAGGFVLLAWAVLNGIKTLGDVGNKAKS